jgi:DNA modification methylase
MNNEFINKIFVGDVLSVLKTLPDELVDCIITSPPYWAQRDYGVEGQIGLEKTPEEYVEKLVTIFREARRVLKKSGTLWLNLGDTYYGGGFRHSDGTDEEFAEKYPKQASNRGAASLETRDKLSKIRALKHPVLKPKDLVGIPWRVALALQEDGWWLRQDIIWHKINAMPEPVKDRFVKSHEYVFLFSKSPDYYFDSYAVKEPYTEPLNRWGGNILIARGESLWDKSTGHSTYRNRNMRPDPRGRNRRDVWSIPTKPFHRAHFATFPEDLIEPMILAGCPEFVCKKCGKPRERMFCKKEHKGEEKPPSPKFANSLVHSAGGRAFYYTEQRKYPVNQKEFAMFLRQYVKGHEQELDEAFTPTMWRHWIRTDDSGGALPDKEQYLILKQICNLPDDYDEKMTETVEILVDDEGDKEEFCGWSDCGCNAGFEPGIVLDPFMGSGTVGLVARKLGRYYIGIELNPQYAEMARERIEELENLHRSLFDMSLFDDR